MSFGNSCLFKRLILGLSENITALSSYIKISIYSFATREQKKGFMEQCTASLWRRESSACQPYLAFVI